MKKIIALILLFSATAHASGCDWTAIKTLPDGGYEYSSQLNLCVGNLVQDAKIKDQQLKDLYSAIDLKNAALVTSDARVKLWMDSAESESDRLAKIQSDQSKSNWIFFGLGALTVIASGFMTAKLIGK